MKKPSNEEDLEQIAFNANLFICNFIDDLIRQIDLDTEYYLNEEKFADKQQFANDVRDILINEIRAYERSCLDNCIKRKAFREETFVIANSLLEDDSPTTDCVLVELRRRLFMNKTLIYFHRRCYSDSDDEVDKIGYLAILDNVYLNDLEIELFKLLISKKLNSRSSETPCESSNFTLRQIILEYKRLKTDRSLMNESYGSIEINENLILIFKLVNVFVNNLKSDLNYDLYVSNHLIKLDAHDECKLVNSNNDLIVNLVRLNIEKLGKCIVENSDDCNQLYLDTMAFNLKGLFLNRNQLKCLNESTALFRYFSFFNELCLVGNKINFISPNAFKYIGQNLRILNLNENYLESIQNGLFINLINLEQLDLNNNQIKYLNAKSFNGLRNLRSLDLKWNCLTKLDEFLFEELENLQSLNLSFNKIEHLKSSNLFKGLKSLTRLDLVGNCLEILENNIFIYLSKLSILNLNSNRLEVIFKNAFYGLDNLEILNFDFNKLNHVNTNQFKHLKLLKQLSFYNNRIEYLNDRDKQDSNKDFIINLLDSLKHLNYLDLRENRLTMSKRYSIKLLYILNLLPTNSLNSLEI